VREWVHNGTPRNQRPRTSGPNRQPIFFPDFPPRPLRLEFDGNTFDGPAESVTYFNVGRVNGILMQMQQRIDLLEGQVEELKAAKEKK